MLNVTMLSIIMLTAIYVECHFTPRSFMLSQAILSAIMLSMVDTEYHFTLGHAECRNVASKLSAAVFSVMMLMSWRPYIPICVVVSYYARDEGFSSLPLRG
jgi:hypothetical protein